MTKPTLRHAWAVWFTVGAGGFTILETIALNLKPEDALSKVIREILGLNTRRGKATKPAFVITAVGFMAWFIPHILTVPAEVAIILGDPDGD